MAHRPLEAPGRPWPPLAAPASACPGPGPAPGRPRPRLSLPPPAHPLLLPRPQEQFHIKYKDTPFDVVVDLIGGWREGLGQLGAQGLCCTRRWRLASLRPQAAGPQAGAGPDSPGTKSARPVPTAPRRAAPLRAAPPAGGDYEWQSLSLLRKGGYFSNVLNSGLLQK
jgi:hypothetical protein